VSKLLPLIEKELSPFHVRPHWGKLFTLAPNALASRYEKLEEFKKMVTTFDPKGKFRNEFLNKYVFQMA
jgi:xylitol oxidase